MIKTIIFDIGGVITHTDFNKLYTNFALRIGVTPEFVTDYHKKNIKALILGTIALDDFWKDMRSGGGNADLDYTAVWLEEWAKLKNVNIELLEIITKLRKKYSVGTLTNLTESRRLIDEKLGLYSYFDYTVLSCVEHLEKPDPKFYQIALSRASVKPEEAVFIDDKEEHTKAAEKVEINSIVYTDNESLLRDLKKFAVELPSM